MVMTWQRGRRRPRSRNYCAVAKAMPALTTAHQSSLRCGYYSFRLCFFRAATASWLTVL